MSWVMKTSDAPFWSVRLVISSITDTASDASRALVGSSAMSSSGSEASAMAIMTR